MITSSIVSDGDKYETSSIREGETQNPALEDQMQRVIRIWATENLL